MKCFSSRWAAVAGALLAGAVWWPANPALGQVSARTTVTQAPDVSGAFSQWIPGTQTVVVSAPGTDATHYVVTRTTTVVDEMGNPVVMERVTRGAPMTVRYVRTADGLVASKIVVHTRPEGGIIERYAPPETAVTPARGPLPVPAPPPAPTPTVATEVGTVTQLSPTTGTLLLGGGQRYVVTGRTVYVDEAGAPIAVGEIPPGAPVTVAYVEEGGRRIVSKMIVRHRVPLVPIPPPAPTVIERTTTTTTTTTVPER